MTQYRETMTVSRYCVALTRGSSDMCHTSARNVQCSQSKAEGVEKVAGLDVRVHVVDPDITL